MRILYYGSARVPSPQAHSLYGVRKCALLSRHVPLWMITPRGDAPYPFETLYNLRLEDYPNLTLWTAPMRYKPLSGIWRRNLAKRWLRQQRHHHPLVYVVQRKSAAYFAALKASGKRQFSLVLEVHDTDELGHNELSAADGLVFTSQSLCNAILAEHPYAEARPSLVAHHRIDHLPEAPASDAFGHSPGQPFLLCYLGSVLRWKDLDTVLEAMGRLPDNFHLRIVGGTGEGGYRGELMRRSCELGLQSRIEFLPFQPMNQLHRYCERAGALLLPLDKNERYRIPFKVLEYLSHARPVIAADLDCVREVLSHEKNALLYEPGSAASLAAEVQRLATMTPEARHGLVCRGLETLVPFTADKWSQRFVDFLSGVVHKPLGRAAA